MTLGMTAAIGVLVALAFLIGCAIGARHGTELRQRTLVRYIRRRAVPLHSPPPMLTELAREIEEERWREPLAREA